MPTEEFAHQIMEINPALRSFALSLTHDRNKAGELIQETHFRAITNEDKFKSGTNLKAWLFTIMKNIFINDYRSRCRRKTILDNAGDASLLQHVPAAGGNLAESELVMEDLHHAIQNLDPKYRVPLMMHYTGYKYQEIAEEMELHLGTVKSRIFFARKLLKEKLGNRLEYLN